MSAAIEHEPSSILDVYGARQWKDPDGTWVISIPVENDKPVVKWALRKLAEAAGKLPQVIWWAERKE